MHSKKFDIFKEIIIGGITKEELLSRLSKAGIQFNQYAEILFNHHQFSPPKEAKRARLVKLRLADLELRDTCSFEEFTGRAADFGLQLCPLSLAAFLRLEYLDQPEGSYLTIASHKIDEKNVPNGFYIRNNDKALWLRGYNADGLDGWPESNEFIFIKAD